MDKKLESALIADFITRRIDLSSVYASVFSCARKEELKSSYEYAGRPSKQKVSTQDVLVAYVFARAYKKAFDFISEHFFFVTKKHLHKSKNDIFSYHFIRFVAQADEECNEELMSYFWTVFKDIPLVLFKSVAFDVALAMIDDSKLKDAASTAARNKALPQIKLSADAVEFMKFSHKTAKHTVTVTGKLIKIDKENYELKSIFGEVDYDITLTEKEINNLIENVAKRIIYSEKIAKIIEEAATENGDFIVYSSDILELAMFEFF